MYFPEEDNDCNKDLGEQYPGLFRDANELSEELPRGKKSLELIFCIYTLSQ